LQVKVPESVLPGQTLVLTKLENNWSIGVAAFELPESITVPIPKGVVPGVEEIPIVYRGVEVTKAFVPGKAKPGIDELRVDRPDDVSQPWGIALCWEPDYPEAVSAMAIEAAQASLRAPAMEANLAYQRLLEAVTEAGGYANPKIARGRAPPLNIPGMLAREDIAKGEIICKIPKELHFSPLTLENCVPELWASLRPANVGVRADEAALFALGARLLHEAEERAVARQDNPSAELPGQSDWLVGADPKIRKVWEAYMDQLLGEDFTHHPMRKVGESRDSFNDVMKPSCMPTHMYKEVKCQHTLYRVVASIADGKLGANFEKGMFLRAMLNFQSRQFKAAVSRSLVPISDLLNHAPVTDPRHSVRWGWNEEEQAHMLTTIRDVSAGEELLQSYGMHPNASFYRCYGFTMPPERENAWCYSVWKDDLPDIFSAFVPLGSTANFSEIHLNTSEVTASLKDVLRDIAENGGNPAYALLCTCTTCIKPYEECAALRPVLESLAKSRAEDPGSHNWWQHLKDGDEALAENEVVRLQMCDYLCLVAFIEAVKLVSGELSDDMHQCLSNARVTQLQLAKYIRELYDKHQWT